MRTQRLALASTLAAALLGLSAGPPTRQAPCTISPVQPDELYVQFGHSTYWTATGLGDPTHPFYGNSVSNRAQISTKVVYEGVIPATGYGSNTEYIGIRTKDQDAFTGPNGVGGVAATIAGGVGGKIKIGIRIHDDGGDGHAKWGSDYVISYSDSATGTPTFVSPTTITSGTITNLEFDIWILGAKGCLDRTDVGLSLNVHITEGVDMVNGILPSHEVIDLEIASADYLDPQGNSTPCEVGWNRWARWLIEESGR